jgi:NAD(P)-dependent dehydrogenase (short-subunit alcohol dehydrogenase family)
MTNGKRTLITGAAGALGHGLAKVLVARGHALILADRAEATPALEAMSRDPGGMPLPIDLARADAWRSALPILEGGPPITGAVLVAGGWQGGKNLWEADENEFSSLMRMNVDTVQQTLRALLPGMVKQGHGSIVVVGSRAVERPWTSAKAAAYAASKAAVVSLAQVVAAETLSAGVRVNAILPSTIDTPANRKSMPNADASRWVSPESIGGLVAFLLGDDSRDVSGAAIPVYGRA